MAGGHDTETSEIEIVETPLFAEFLIGRDYREGGQRTKLPAMEILPEGLAPAPALARGVPGGGFGSAAVARGTTRALRLTL